MEKFIEIFQGLILGAMIGSLFYFLPYMIKRGWEDGRNASAKNARVCNLCFKNIAAWNAEVERKLKELEPKP